MSSAENETGRSMVKILRTCKRSEILPFRGHSGITRAKKNRRTVLQDITNHPELIKVAATSFCSERLLECDLHVADRVLVPAGTHSDVSKAKDEQILDHLLPEVVVNTERLVFGPVLLKSVEELSAGVEVLAERFLDDDAIDALLAIAVLLAVGGDGDEDGWWKSEVEETMALLTLVARLDLLDVFLEVLEGGVILISTGDVAAELLEFLDLGVNVLIVVWVFDVRGGAFVELCLIHLCASIADDFDVSREEAIAIEAEEGRKGLYRPRMSM